MTRVSSRLAGRAHRPPRRATNLGDATLALAVMLFLAGTAPALAQIDGHVSLLFDVLPDIGDEPGSQSVSELRARLFVERRQDVGRRVRLNLAGYVDGLLADRGASVRPPSAGPALRRELTGLGRSGGVSDAVVRPSDLYVDFIAARFDVRVGASRLVWGRLDEFQPTDVINPIDLTRFLLDGRAEARLPVGLVRARLFGPGSSTLEAVLVPAFRAGRFDQLDEDSSPFNLTATTGAAEAGYDVRVDRAEPALARRNMQGGARFTSTFGRVDWGVSAYRGFRTFPTITLAPPRPESRSPSPGLIRVESFPRFTMVGGEFETVRGPWGFRGEAAAFLEDELQSTRAARGVPGRTIEGGVGVDRRAGDYRVAGNVLLSWRGVGTSDSRGEPFDDDEALQGTDVTLVVAADRSFARETRTMRVFAVYDPADSTAFGRVIAAVSVRDNVWLEGSAGTFAGASADTLGQLTRRDFLYVHLKVLF